MDTGTLSDIGMPPTVAASAVRLSVGIPNELALTMVGVDEETDISLPAFTMFTVKLTVCV